MVVISVVLVNGGLVKSREEIHSIIVPYQYLFGQRPVAGSNGLVLPLFSPLKATSMGSLIL